MTPEPHDELERRLADSLERSTHTLDADTQQQLQDVRRAALATKGARHHRPALMIAASVVALVLVTLVSQPWRTTRAPQDLLGQHSMSGELPAQLPAELPDELPRVTAGSNANDSNANGNDTNSSDTNDSNGSDSYLGEDPELLADWDLLDAIGEVPDA